MIWSLYRLKRSLYKIPVQRVLRWDMNAFFTSRTSLLSSLLIPLACLVSSGVRVYLDFLSKYWVLHFEAITLLVRACSARTDAEIKMTRTVFSPSVYHIQLNSVTWGQPVYNRTNIEKNVSEKSFQLNFFLYFPKSGCGRIEKTGKIRYSIQLNFNLVSLSDDALCSLAENMHDFWLLSDSW